MGSQHKIRQLPREGKVIVISDLHGNLHDFEAVVGQTRVFERMTAGEKLYLVIMGDVCDVERHKIVESDIPPRGDVHILDQLIEIRKNLSDKDQIVYLEGNHDFHILRIFEEMRQIGCKNVDEYVQEYQDSYGDFIYQNNLAPYDMIYRARPEHLEFISSGPLMVTSPSGLVIVHAGPVRHPFPEDIREKIDGICREDHFFISAPELYDSYYIQLLCNRYCLDQYSLEDLAHFLRAFDAKIMISGHTPLPHFQSLEGKLLDGCQLHEGMVILGGMQVIIATSFGAPSEQKRYLELDLSKTYHSPLEWKEGQEIFSLKGSK